MKRADAGASLIIALGVLIAISGVLAGLITFVTSSTRSAVNLERTRNELYAADGAVETAIRVVQDDATSSGLLGAACPNDARLPQPMITNGVSIWVQCRGQATTILTPGNQLLLQRNVLFIACAVAPNPATGCSDEQAVIKAKVNFPTNAAGRITSSFIQSWSVRP